ncbi:MAG: hypothetical protein ABFS56_15120 [Pseudomonadota bacterium]
MNNLEKQYLAHVHRSWWASFEINSFDHALRKPNLNSIHLLNVKHFVGDGGEPTQIPQVS